MVRGPAPTGSSLSDYVSGPRRTAPKRGGTKKKAPPVSVTTLERELQKNTTLSPQQKANLLADAMGIPRGSHRADFIQYLAREKFGDIQPTPSSGRGEGPNLAPYGLPNDLPPRGQPTGLPPRGQLGIGTPRGAHVDTSSPSLGGPPGTRLPYTVNDITATQQQGEHLTVVHHVAGNTPGELRRETQQAIADEAEQKLLAGQSLSQQEIGALQQQGRLGLNQNSTGKALDQGLFSGTGIITGYEPIPMPQGSEGAERIRKPGVQGKPNETGTNTTGKRPVVKTAGQLEDELSNKSVEEIKALQKKLRDANYLPQSAAISGYVDPDTITAYDELLKETANYQSHYRDLTPDQFLDRKIAGINAAGASKTNTSRTTQTSVNLTDPITAKGYLVGSMRTLLGRMPTAGEINSFVQTLNTAEQNNPNVTTTTSTSTQNGAGTNTNTNTQSVSSGGVGSGADFGDDFIMQQNMPELRASNAVQFYQLALQALRSPVSV